MSPRKKLSDEERLARRKASRLNWKQKHNALRQAVHESVNASYADPEIQRAFRAINRKNRRRRKEEEDNNPYLDERIKPKNTIQKLERERDAAIWQVAQDRKKLRNAAWRQWFKTGRLPANKPDENDPRWSIPGQLDGSYGFFGPVKRADGTCHPLLVEQQRIWEEYKDKIRAFRMTAAYRLEQAKEINAEAVRKVEYITALLEAPYRLKRKAENITQEERNSATHRLKFYQARLDAYAQKDGVRALLKLIEEQNNDHEYLLGCEGAGPRRQGKHRQRDHEDGGPPVLHTLLSEEEGQRWKAQQEKEAAIQTRWKQAKAGSLSYAEYVELHQEDWQANHAPELSKLEERFEEATTPAQRRKGGPFSLEVRLLRDSIEELNAMREPLNRKAWLQWLREQKENS